MSSLILTRATAVGTLVLGAAALGGCASKSADPNSPGATQGVTVATSSSSGSSSGSGSSASASPGTADASACTGSVLSLKIKQGSSGMGHTGSVLVFTNTGSKTCTLNGYPGADVTDNGQYNWASLMNATRVSGGVAVNTVSLKSGASASAMLEWDVTPRPGAGDAPNAANCAGMAGGYLEITPPNTKATKRSLPPENMCTSLQVFPVVAGTTGR
jgi:hypothetical protein